MGNLELWAEQISQALEAVAAGTDPNRRSAAAFLDDGCRSRLCWINTYAVQCLARITLGRFVILFVTGLVAAALVAVSFKLRFN